MASSNSPPSASMYFNPSTMIQQNWSFPESIIYYIAKNPGSYRVYDKMTDTCKYFFYKNPIIIVACLNYCKKRNDEEEEMDIDNASDASDTVDFDDDAEMGESKDDDSDLNDDEDMEEDSEIENDSDGNDDFVEDAVDGDIDNDAVVNVGVAKTEEKKKWRACLECDCEKNGCCLEIDDLKNFNCKIWVSSDIHIDGFDNIHSELIPKLANFEFDRLLIVNNQISFDDLALFCKTATGVMFMDLKVTYNDGKVVPLEDILDCIPNLFSFIYDFPADASSISSKTAISFFNRNEKFTHAILTSIPETFDIESFGGTIDKNRKFSFSLTFSDDISYAYKLKLDTFVDTVINEFPNFGLMIIYPGQDMEKHMLLRAR